MKTGAFAVILDDERRVLLCHRRDMDAWNLPGGGVEASEAPWDAVVREVREEVGLEAAVVRLTGLYWKPDTDELVFNFECRVLSGTPGTSDEADAARYFALDDLPADMPPKQGQRIRDALAGGAVAMRVQTGPGIRDHLAERSRA